MSEREAIIQSMLEHAMQHAALVRPENDWYLAECFAGSRMIQRKGGTPYEALEALRVALWLEFSRMFEVAAIGGVDLEKLIGGAGR